LAEIISPAAQMLPQLWSFQRMLSSCSIIARWK